MDGCVTAKLTGAETAGNQETMPQLLGLRVGD